MTDIALADLTRPIIGIEHRTAQEVFDIMCDRFRRSSPSQVAPANPAQVTDKRAAWIAEAKYDALVEEANDFAERMTSQPWACELIEKLLDTLTAAIGAGGQAVAENARLRALPLKDEVERVLEQIAAGMEVTLHTGEKAWVDRDDAGEMARALLSRLRAGEQEGWKSVRETMWGEVIENDDGEIVFQLCEEDNRDGPHEIVEITLLASTFPVGARISISEPTASPSVSEQGGDRG